MSFHDDMRRDVEGAGGPLVDPVDVSVKEVDANMYAVQDMIPAEEVKRLNLSETVGVPWELIRDAETTKMAENQANRPDVKAIENLNQRSVSTPER